MPQPALPDVLPWHPAELLSWPETILAGGQRWTRQTAFCDETALGAEAVLTVQGPQGRTLYRGTDEAAADAAVKADILARFAAGDLQAPNGKG